MTHPYFQSDPVKAAHAIIDPATIDVVAGKYIGAGLIPTSLTGFTFSQGNSYSDSDALIGKFDYLPSTSSHFSLTVGANRQDLVNPFTYANVPGFSTDDQLRGEFVSFSYSRVFSPRLVNSLKISVNRNDRELQEPDSSQPTAAELGVNIHPDVSNGPPLLLFSSGMQVGYADRGTSRFVSNTYTLGDTVSWQRAKHQFTFGTGLSIFQNNTNASYLVNGQFVFYGTATSNDLADFLLGFPSAYLQAPNASSHIRSKFIFGFAQDEWKIAPSFSVNFGVRYEYSTPKTETQINSIPSFRAVNPRNFPTLRLACCFQGMPGRRRVPNFPDRAIGRRVSVFLGPPATTRPGGSRRFRHVLRHFKRRGQSPIHRTGAFCLQRQPFLRSSHQLQRSAELSFESFCAAGVIDPFPSRTPPRNLNFAASGLLPVGDLVRDVFVVDPHLQTPYTYQYGVNL